MIFLKNIQKTIDIDKINSIKYFVEKYNKKKKDIYKKIIFMYNLLTILK